MAITEELRLVIKTEAEKAIKNVRKFDKKLGETENAMKQMGKMAIRAGAMLLGAFGARKLFQIGKNMVAMAGVQEEAIARLDAAIRSTGGAAGLTSAEMQDMASSFQKVTKYGDEAIIGAQSMLLTFTKIGKEVFPAATEAILNMSEAMGQDLKSSALQIGKALNDPILGLTALGRAGVQFTEEQKKLVKSFMEVGDHAEAQGLILAELETQFGGMAMAAADTASGSMAQLRNSLGDLQEVGGSMIAMFLQPSVKFFTALADEAGKAWGRLIAIGALFDEAGYAKAAGDIGLAQRAYDQLTEEIERLTRAQEAGMKTAGRTYKETQALIAEMYQIRWGLFEDIKELEDEAVRIAGERKAEEERITAELAEQRDLQEQIAAAARVAMVFATKLDAAFAKTLSPKERLEAELAYWDAIIDTQAEQEEQRQAVVAWLKEELALLEDITEELDEPSEAFEKIVNYSGDILDELRLSEKSLGAQNAAAAKRVLLAAKAAGEEARVAAEAAKAAAEMEKQAEQLKIVESTLDGIVSAAESVSNAMEDGMFDTKDLVDIIGDIAPAFGPVGAIIGVLFKAMSKLSEGLDDLQEWWNRVVLGIDETKDALEEMESGFTDTGESFGEMVDGMMHDLDDVLEAIGQTFDQELWLIQHLLEEGMIDVEEYLRRLGELEDWKATEEAGAGGGGGGGSGTIGSGGSPPSLPAAIAAPTTGGLAPVGGQLFPTTVPVAGGPSYSYAVTIIGPGSDEETAKTVLKEIQTLDRRRRL